MSIIKDSFGILTVSLRSLSKQMNFMEIFYDIYFSIPMGLDGNKKTCGEYSKNNSSFDSCLTDVSIRFNSIYFFKKWNHRSVSLLQHVVRPWIKTFGKIMDVFFHSEQINQMSLFVL